MSLREAILKKDDLPRVPVDCKEWTDEPLFIRTMTGRERDEYETLVYKKRQSGQLSDLMGIKAFLVVRCLVDASGVRVFSDDDSKAVQEKSGSVINRLSDVALHANGFTDDDVEDLEKNSDSAPSASSGSTS